MANDAATANDLPVDKHSDATEAYPRTPTAPSCAPPHVEHQGQPQNVDSAPALLTGAPHPAPQAGQHQSQVDDSTHAETAREEEQHGEATPSRSKRAKSVRRTPKKRSNQDQDNGLFPYQYKEDLISLCLDHWRARAVVISQNDQVDWTNLTFGDGLPREGFSVFDGFDKTWYVHMDGSSPLPLSKQGLVQSLQKRRDALEAISTRVSNKDMVLQARYYLQQEARKMCQNEWDDNINEPNKPPMNWADVRPKFQSLSSLIRMIAKTRLIDGRALLPGYYHVKIVELTPGGKIMVRRVSMPFGVGFAGFSLRLDTWSLVNGEQSREALRETHKMLDIAMKNGTEEGKERARKVLRKFAKPGYAPSSDGATWRFKHHVRDGCPIQLGKTPGRIRGWKFVSDEESLNELEEGARAGRYVIAVRTWKIHLRQLWSEVNELQSHLQPEIFGEPELNEGQLTILDDLLAGQNDRAREQGARVARVLNWLNQPMTRSRLATNLADRNDLGNGDSDQGVGEVNE
ncbi:hypothetical protein AK830_g542 [Neonectria ditissima]|uniref:Uncharacterized protein n=1 Tax=Neonectria ditissima TaxID=78410 RepID=A0A0P7C260_9HYPO|nr:hypothetical protein AK830_g542 [Neonectria ditissima]